MRTNSKTPATPADLVRQEVELRMGVASPIRGTLKAVSGPWLVVERSVGGVAMVRVEAVDVIVAAENLVQRAQREDA